ncbi:MAG: galactose-1-phosphate uridylyltransferase [Acidobacteriota bacterium]|nr:MAG: galactose-1-phosphate uridylyltransferase [Acidobacteriota bacterium]
MSELRHDPVSRRWVIVAAERSLRPNEFQIARPVPPNDEPPCPFCPGQEAGTPKELYAVRDGDKANAPDWRVRVIPNKRPVLAIEGTLDRRGLGLYDRMRGIGAHEIVIETPQHKLRPFELPHLQFAAALTAARTRLVDLLKDSRFKYALLHKNYGQTAGATIFHPTQQIVATPVTPFSVATKLQTSRAHFHLKERCLFCDMIAQEIEDGSRVVQIDEHFVTFAPYAARFPFELQVYPRQHAHQFTGMGDRDIERLASHMLGVFSRLNTVLGDPPLNWMVVNAPNTETQFRRGGYWSTLEYDFHWHIEILPRLTPLAGFEWGTGFYINPTAPEDAAAFLRDAAT